ncbi:hypothetical protein J2Z76_002253 [Sedimentibacter acidaminivorans]|uniref:DUF3810 domain-containing protein n=1 Tax=Sedimentibacter acidaminivorans TaxID=913099 RepID=A0ABS4GFB4_9FIRM|nr:DUF3810 domain-containing protein [Sedimentibacter acidaminivorans]MBP1926388.1 hypothetical protein [Sedimentibacter acidaminivorans]
MKNKRLMIILLMPIAFILTQIAKYNINFAEFYSIKIYPVFAQSIGFVTGFFPFSIAEILLILSVILLISYTVLTFIKSLIKKTIKLLKNYIINLGVVVSLLYFLFVLFCGMNYYRYEFTAYSGFEIKKSSKQELIQLCDDLINDANEYRKKIGSDTNGVAALSDDNIYETSRRVQYSFNSISNSYDVLKGNYPRPKPILFSRAMSYTQITGVFFPFTFESNVNVDIPSYQIPATMCHELVHMRGFMREDEANFVSYLTCISSGYDDFAYSGTMLALTYSMNALYLEDYHAFVQLYEKYSKDVKLDMAYTSTYWEQFQTRIAKISHNVNNTYLKANNQVDGVKSYGRMVDLLVAMQRNKQ